MADLKQWWRGVRPRVLSNALYGLLRFVGSTVRMKAINFPEQDSGAIICGWHGRSFLFANGYRNRGYWVIISQSNDGEMQSRIFRRLGFQIIRGSTGRGGVRAAVEGIRALKEGGTLALTPDGPRGPSHVVQSGIMMIAQKSGGRIIPAALSARPRLIAKSWDKYMFPIPFGKAVVIYGDPITVPKTASEEEVEQIRLRVQDEINRLEKEADRMMGY